MVSESIEPLKAYATEGLTPGVRLLAWAGAATDSDYSVLAVNIWIFSSELWMCSTSSLPLGYWAREPKP